MRLRALVSFLVLVLGGLQGGTQYVAHVFGYHDALGAPIVRLSSFAVYSPWAWFAWANQWEEAVPYAFQTASALTAGGVALGIFALLLFSAAGKGPNASDAHGSARWAADKDLKRAGLLGTEGVVLCQTGDACFVQVPAKDGSGPRWKMKQEGDVIRHNGPEHVFCFAPTRSGKGVGLVIPTLLSWTGSVLVYDIKKELWSVTAGFRRTFSHCLRFEPSALDSLRFNPLDEIRQGVLAVRDAQTVADILVDPDGSGDKRDHWQTTAHSLLVAAILHVLYAENDKSLSGVATFLSDPFREQVETLNRMLETHHLGKDGPHPAIAGAAREMLNKSENELSGVFSTAMACLGLYRDPIVARSTSASDFRIADLMSAEHPVSLYLVVPPSDIDRLRPLVRLVLNQVGRRLTEKMESGPAKGYRHRLLFLLDEFPSLGRLSFFETQLAFLAGYGIKCFLIAQSLNQIEKAYGPNNSILDNTHVRVTYTANDERTARRISELLGMGTRSDPKKTRSGKLGALWFENVSESVHEHARALLTPGEILQLPADEAILLVGNAPPYRAKKVMYFLDPRFVGRAFMVPPDSLEDQQRELVHRDHASPWEAVHRPALSRIPTARAVSASTIKSPEEAAAPVAPLESAVLRIGERSSSAEQTPDPAPSDPGAPSDDSETRLCEGAEAASTLVNGTTSPAAYLPTDASGADDVGSAL